MGHILDINVPERNPGGAPGGDYERIESSPVDFGGSVGQAEEKLGGGIEKAADTGMNALVARQQLTNEVHSSEVNTWLADRITDRYSKFSQLEGRAALDGLPQYKKDVEDLYQQSFQQAGSPSEQAMIAKSGRTLTDNFYRYGTTHANQQWKTWNDQTATNRATSFGNMAVLAVNHPDDMKRYLDTSDDEVSKLFESRAWDREAIDSKVSENRGYNIRKLVDQQMALGDPNQAAEIFTANRSRMDAASIVAVEKALKPKLQQQAFEVGGAVALGRQPAQDAFQFHERSSGLPAGYTARVINLESGGDPNAQSGSYRGLAQFSPALMKKYGVSDPGDVAQNAGALMQEAAANRPSLARVLGRDPTAAELYLAHQQGVGGASAQLANPDRPAWRNMASTGEGRAKGEDWAKQAIWGNMTPQMKAAFPGGVDTVTGGDFTKLWGQRYNRGGDQVPVVDKAEAYKRADAMFGNDPVMWRGVRSVIDREVNYQNTVFAGRRTELTKQVPDILAAAADGNTTLSLPPDLPLLGHDHAQQISDQFEVAKQIGQYRQRLQWASPGEVQEIQRDLEGGAGPVSQTIKSHADRGSTGPGVAGTEASADSAEFYRQRRQGASSFNAAAEARDKLLVGPNADPAAYVASHPTVAKAAADMNANPSDPAAFDRYATAVLGLQEYLGVPFSQRKVLTTDQATRINDAVETASGKGDAAQVSALLQQVEKQSGDHWPEVYRQLAPNASPLVQVVGSGIQPWAATKLINGFKLKEIDLLKNQEDPEAKLKDITKNVDENLRDFFKTLSGSERDQTVTTYRSMATKLASMYMFDTPHDTAGAAKKAADDIVNFKYDFKDTYRIPRDKQIDADTIQAGAVEARRLIGDAGAAEGALAVTPKTDRSFPGRTDLAEDTAARARNNGVWLTDPHEKGLVLYQPDGTAVRRPDGSALMLSWQQLTDLGKSRSAQRNFSADQALAASRVTGSAAP